MSAEKLLGAKISEIDETPYRWKVMGVVFAIVVFYNVTFGAPFWFFHPGPALIEMIPRSEAIAVFALSVPFAFPLGIYAGHVFHEMLVPNDSSDTEN